MSMRPTVQQSRQCRASETWAQLSCSSSRRNLGWSSRRHEVVGWAYVHASFLHNAFAVRGGATPFERAFGVTYKDKLACFGEVVYFALSQNNIKKGKPKFIKGVFLGKSLNNDMNICGTALGVYLSSTVRRLPTDQQWSKHMLKEMQGRPHKYSLGVLGNVIMAGMKERLS